MIAPKPPIEVAAPWLSDALGMPQEQATQLLNVVHGSPLLGLSFKSGGDQALRSELIIGLKSVLQQKLSPLELASKYAKGDALVLISWLYSLLVDVSKLHLAGEACEIVNADMRKMLNTLSQRSKIHDIHKLADKVQGHRSALLARQNPNKQLLLEDLFLDWKNLI